METSNTKRSQRRRPTSNVQHGGIQFNYHILRFGLSVMITTSCVVRVCVRVRVRLRVSTAIDSGQVYG